MGEHQRDRAACSWQNTHTQGFAVRQVHQRIVQGCSNDQPWCLAPLWLIKGELCCHQMLQTTLSSGSPKGKMTVCCSHIVQWVVHHHALCDSYIKSHHTSSAITHLCFICELFIYLPFLFEQLSMLTACCVMLINRWGDLHALIDKLLIVTLLCDVSCLWNGVEFMYRLVSLSSTLGATARTRFTVLCSIAVWFFLF